MGTNADKNQKKKKKIKERKESVGSAQVNDTSKKHGIKIITDTRFSTVHSDPRFQKVPKHQSKVAIDSRFNRMFSDKRFSSSSSRLDKRGKPKEQNSENPLHHYYRLEEEDHPKNKDEFSNDDDDLTEKTNNGNLQKLDYSLSDPESSSESEPLKSSSESGGDSSSTNSDTDDEDAVYSEEEAVEPEEKIPEIEQETCRLAILNMDWSQVRAVDLYVLMSSFLPKGGQILSVAVYPSEFGLKRMEEEAVHGPIGLFDSEKEKSDDDDDDADDEIDSVKLRGYEKSRLRYYYAVLVCDSSATADYLYKTCDRTEFERTSNVLDLRFIPDSMEFKHPPRDIATEAPTNYEGLDFQTRALQQSKIHLSWDEDEPQRAKTLKRNFNANQLAELELKEFLASDDGGSNDDESDEAVDGQSEKKLDKRDKYLSLLQAGNGSDGDGEEDDQDMEVTFNTGLEDISKRILEKKKDKESETVWEAYLRKRNEKRKARKNRSKDSSEDDSSDTDQEAPEQPDDFFIEEPSAKSNRKEKQGKEMEKEQEASRRVLELLFPGDQGADTHNKKGYNLKLKKGKKEKEFPAGDKLPSIDYDDPRFSSMFTSPLFALDPTDPQYKRSAAYARKLESKRHNIAEEEIMDREQMKQPRQAQLALDGAHSRKDEQLPSDEMSSKKKARLELSSLVRSVKNKAQQVQVSSHYKAPKEDVPLQSDGSLKKRGNHELSSLVHSVQKKSRTLQS